MPYTIIGAIGELILDSTKAQFKTSTTEPANSCVYMDLNNQVYFTGNLILKSGYSANTTFATLPDEKMYPSQTVKIPILRATSTASVLTIDTNGKLSINASVSSNTNLWLSGLAFNCGGRYYNPEIGNIYDNGTSPLSEV